MGEEDLVQLDLQLICMIFLDSMSTNHQSQLRLGVGCRQGDFRDDGLNGRAQVYEYMNMYEPGVAENETV